MALRIAEVTQSRRILFPLQGPNSVSELKLPILFIAKKADLYPSPIRIYQNRFLNRRVFTLVRRAHNYGWIKRRTCLERGRTMPQRVFYRNNSRNMLVCVVGNWDCYTPMFGYKLDFRQSELQFSTKWGWFQVVVLPSFSGKSATVGSPLYMIYSSISILIFSFRLFTIRNGLSVVYHTNARCRWWQTTIAAHFIVV